MCANLCTSEPTPPAWTHTNESIDIISTSPPILTGVGGAVIDVDVTVCAPLYPLEHRLNNPLTSSTQAQNYLHHQPKFQSINIINPSSKVVTSLMPERATHMC